MGKNEKKLTTKISEEVDESEQQKKQQKFYKNEMEKKLPTKKSFPSTLKTTIKNETEFKFKKFLQKDSAELKNEIQLNILQQQNFTEKSLQNENEIQTNLLKKNENEIDLLVKVEEFKLTKSEDPTLVTFCSANNLLPTTTKELIIGRTKEAYGTDSEEKISQTISIQKKDENYQSNFKVDVIFQHKLFTKICNDNAVTNKLVKFLSNKQTNNFNFFLLTLLILKEK